MNRHSRQSEATAQLREAAQALGLKFHTLKAGSERDFDAAFQAVVQSQASALVVAPDALFIDRRDQIVALELNRVIPTASPLSIIEGVPV
jgi:hypothetical protein